jgi:hypothetical protein
MLNRLQLCFSFAPTWAFKWKVGYQGKYAVLVFLELMHSALQPNSDGLCFQHHMKDWLSIQTP